MNTKTPEGRLRDATQALTTAQIATTNAQARRDNTIRDLFCDHGYTKYQIAQMAGLSQTMIARIINDT